MTRDTLSLIVLFALLIPLFTPFVQKSRVWRATATPLASIIGSGFLVVAPILFLAVGKFSFVAISLLVVLGYACGAVMRFNIIHLEPILGLKKVPSLSVRIEGVSRMILGVAYAISVAFYLKLLAVFILRFLPWHGPHAAELFTTIILLAIAIAGKLKGLDALEFLEGYSVSAKLAVIGAFLAALIHYNASLLLAGNWVPRSSPGGIHWSSIQILMGSLIVVQGFETSRFLGEKYDAEERVKTMRLAQIISGAIYISFVGLMAVVFPATVHISDTEIIDLSRIVAPTLPILLLVAAAASQFSAAIADTIGAGGLLIAEFKTRLSQKNSYLVVTGIALCLTWVTNVFEVVSLASRAFALFYCLQAVSASLLAKEKKDYSRATFFFLLALLLLAITICGKSAEA